MKGQEFGIEQFRVTEEPFYQEVTGEIGLFKVAASQKIPVMLKGPTGCGKTRFVQHMAYQLNRPLITVACHEDLTSKYTMADRLRPCGPVFIKRGRNHLGGWTAYPGSQTRGHRIFG